MTDTDTTASPTTPSGTDRQTRRLARNIQRFARAHATGGEAGADAVVQYIGRGNTRIVLVGADGAWGDQVARDYASARAAVEEAGVTLHEEFPNDLALRVSTGPYEWKRMAGIQLGG